MHLLAILALPARYGWHPFNNLGFYLLFSPSPCVLFFKFLALILFSLEFEHDGVKPLLTTPSLIFWHFHCLKPDFRYVEPLSTLPALTLSSLFEHSLSRTTL